MPELIEHLALRDYEPRVTGYTDQLLLQLEKTKGNPIDMTTWFNFYSFDIMGDMAFGKSFNMLRDGVKHQFMTTLHSSMINIGIFSHMLYLFPVFKGTPVLNHEYKKNEAWIKDQVETRKKVSICSRFLSVSNSHVSDETGCTRCVFMDPGRIQCAWQTNISG
jgi:hypothetical protein